VTLTDVAGFTGFNGDVRWVGPPVEHPEEGSGTMTAAQLQCEPHFMDWGDIGLLHVYGASLVPSSTYDVRVIHETCAAASSDDASYSDALTIRTAQWGDVVNPFATDGGATQPDFGDIAALVDKFTAGPTAPIKARAQLQPNVPDPSQAVNFSDIAIIVDAFTGVTYPFEGPGVCP
jgi:hypothetical protein